MPKNASLHIAGVTTKPAPVIVAIDAPTPDELARKAIAGLTQDQILALHTAGQLAAFDDGALWRAYMGRIAARQDRKATKVAKTA